MMKTVFALAGAAILVASFGIHPVSAQKAKDTLRIALSEPIAGVSPYDFGLDEMVPIYVEIYTPLLAMEQASGKYIGELAKSWNRVDDKTWDFELRDDVTLHTGKHFDADDMVATVNYIVDPKTKVQNKQRYTFVESAEKLSPTRLRLHLVKAEALSLLFISNYFTAMDGEVLKKMENGADYGRLSAASAGPYKVVSVDRTKGFVLERFEQMSKSFTHRRAPIKRIEIIPVPDRQTQVAQLLTGGVDMLRNVPPDVAQSLKDNHAIEITATPSNEFAYFMLDTLGRSGRRELQDIRVRKAIFMAIDRGPLARDILAGGKSAQVLDALCFDFNSACTHSTKPYGYDPAAAKKLLAEAGYPNGFELPLFAYTPMKDVAVAISGDLQKIGIKATVRQVAINVYRKMRDDGELTTFVATRPTSSFPDATMVLDGFFGGERDYWKDPIILDAMKTALTTADDTQRGKVLEPALNRANEMAYILPIAGSPWVFAHSHEVRIENNLLRANSVHISDFFWR
jgi:peptide/nickel transport system substrate-binding protein